jgi:hypothetical protein
MRKLRELFRLRFEAKLSTRAIATSLNMGNGTVCDYLGRARVAKLPWPLPPDQLQVWGQLKAALNGTHPGEQVLTDELLHSFHLDADLDYSVGLPPSNPSRLLVHPPGSWAVRPEVASAIPNLCLAGDYVRTHTDLASMEGACEAGRRAANVILDRIGSTTARAAIWKLEEPATFESWKRLDAALHRRGRPHLFELLGINDAFEAADLLRRFGKPQR